MKVETFEGWLLCKVVCCVLSAVFSSVFVSFQMRFITNLTNWNEKKPALYHGHLAYLDFSRSVVRLLPFTAATPLVAMPPSG